MARLFAWVVDRLRWLALAAAVFGAVLVYFGWSDAARIRDVEANGIETVAGIEGATRTKGRRSGETYSLKLVWRDSKGAVQTHDKVTISSTFARQIIVNDRIVRQAVRIKYLPDATIDSVPIVLEDAARQEEQDQFMVTLGLGLAGFGVVGSGLFFLIGRRRHSDPAGPAAHA
jgi:hypothetical protein